MRCVEHSCWPLAPSSERRASVLVVDDEPAIRSGVRRILEAGGYHAVAVGSGEEALALMQAREFQAVICDFHLPGLSGAELFERIFEVAPALAGRLLVVTGDPSPPVLRGLATLAKPFFRDDLPRELGTICPPTASILAA